MFIRGIKIIFISICLFFGLLHAQQNTIGTIQISDQAYDGYTLFSPTNSVHTYLIDNCGNLINTWESDKPPGLSVYLLPNGNIVRTRREVNNTFFAGGVGGGIEIFNWDGERIWEFVLSNEQNVLHHDISVLPNGNILAIAYDLVIQEEAIALGRRLEIAPAAGLWVDKIIEIEPLPNNDFDIVWEWSSVEHIIQNNLSGLPNFGEPADHPGKIDLNYFDGNPGSDWLHCNSIDYNEELDQILLNSRNHKEFYIIDHSTTTEEARGSEGGNYGMGGDFLYRWGNPAAYESGTGVDQQLFSQHDAAWIDAGLPNEGKIFVYNNGLDRPSGVVSSVDMISPPIQADGTYVKEGNLPFGPSQAEFSYGNNAGDEDITSFRMAGVSMLQNGNFVVTVASDGRIIEFDENLNVAWEYVLPNIGSDVQSQGATPRASLFRSFRYALDYPAFENNEVIVGEPIELEPNNEFCEGLVSVKPADLPAAPFEIVNTVVHNDMLIRSAIETRISIVDVLGNKRKQVLIFEGEQMLNLDDLEEGIYYIGSLNPNYSIFRAIPFVKMN